MRSAPRSGCGLRSARQHQSVLQSACSPHIVRLRVARPLCVAGSQLSPHAVTTLTTGSVVGTRPVSTDPATARRGRCPLIVIAMTPTNRQRARPGIRIAGDGDTRGQRHPEWVSTDTPLDNPFPIGNQLGTAHLWGEAASEGQSTWYSWPLTYSSTETGNPFLEPFGLGSRRG